MSGKDGFGLDQLTEECPPAVGKTRAREQRFVKDLSSLPAPCLSGMLAADSETVRNRLEVAAKVKAIMDSVATHFELSLPFDLAFVIVCDFRFARTITQSNDISTRSILDSARDLEIIDTSMQCPFDGFITEWHYFAKRHSKLTASVWRKQYTVLPRYSLVGYNALPVTAAPAKLTHKIPKAERIAVKKGDFVGHRCDGQSGIPFVYCQTPHKCDWKYPIPKSMLAQSHHFHEGDFRDYAYGFTIIES